MQKHGCFGGLWASRSNLPQAVPFVEKIDLWINQAYESYCHSCPAYYYKILLWQVVWSCLKDHWVLDKIFSFFFFFFLKCLLE